MKIKQKLNFKSFAVLGILVIASVMANFFVSTSTTYAWCDEDLDNAGCDAENWDTLTGGNSSEYRGWTFEKYKEFYEKCAGDTKGLDADRGECANAVYHCLRNAIDTSECEDYEAAADFAIDCKDGKTTSGCDSTKYWDNEAQFSKARDKIKDDASSSCSNEGINQNKQTEIEDRKNECKSTVDDAVSSCASKLPKEERSGYSQDHDYRSKKYNEYGFNDYKKCINDYVKNHTTNEGVCKKFGGFYGTSTGRAGEGDGACRTSLNDFRTENGCKQAGGEIVEDANGPITKDGKKYKCEEKGTNAALDKCSEKYPDKNSNEYKACTAAVNDPNKDCSRETDPKLKEACELGKGAAPAPATPPGPTNPQSRELTCKDASGNSSTNCDVTVNVNDCGEARTNFKFGDSNGACDDSTKGSAAFKAVLSWFLRILVVGVGLAAVGGVVYAAILYTTAEDNASQISQAKDLLRNIAIGLLLFIFLTAALNWLIPGGIFG